MSKMQNDMGMRRRDHSQPRQQLGRLHGRAEDWENTPHKGGSKVTEAKRRQAYSRDGEEPRWSISSVEKVGREQAGGLGGRL